MKNNSYKKFKNKQISFYISIIALPLIQVAIFYFYVNFKSFLFAFQKYDYSSGKFLFIGLDNIKTVITDMVTEPYLVAAMKNSWIVLSVSLIIGSPFAVLFPYYIFKNRFLGESFKVVLFMPSIISSIILVVIYKYFVVHAIPSMAESIVGFKVEFLHDLIGNNNSAFYTIIIYCILMGFSGNLLLYLGAMKAISSSVIEAAELDGATYTQQLLYIFFPLIWPTFATFIVLSFAGVFNNQMGLYQFYGDQAPSELWTYGYYLYRSMITFGVTFADYPYLSGIAIILTIISVPLALLIRRSMFKYGPSMD